jgi:drug/metabolite transporter (DMT)-like permease
MSAAVIGLALLAAFFHASWNAFLRTGADRLWTVTVMSFASTAIALPFAIYYGLPEPGVWPYVIASAVLQVAYSVLLVAAYREGELGQVYPIVRGSVPLLVLLGASVMARQHPTLLQTVGVSLVAGGIASLSFGRGRAPTTSILCALVTGAIIALYATVDAIGVRVAGSAGAYAAWVLVIYGFLQPATFLVWRGRLAIDVRSPETRNALAGGVVALFAYALVVAAFKFGPAGPVAAIRETSVVFAALIGWLFLGEKLTPRRIAACAVVTLGAVCLGYRP